MLRGSWRLCNK